MLILVPGRDPLLTSGGSESYVVAHARAAIRAGYEPHLFTLARRTARIETDFGVVHRVATPVLPARSISSVLQRPWLVPAIVRLADGQPGRHVIHGFGAWADAAVVAARRLQGRGVRATPLATVYVLTAHESAAKLGNQVVSARMGWQLAHRLELAWTREVTLRVERHAFGACPALVVNYNSVRTMLDELCAPGLPVRRLPYSAPVAFQDPLGELPLPAPLEGFGDPAAPLIVSVSRHDGRKGIDVLIEALGALRDAGVAFRACLVGPGVLLAEHRRLVAELRLGDRVLVPGRVAHVAPFLAHADVYVLPSLEEGSGSLSVLEALQLGRAIVSTDVDGLPEDLTHEHDALLVPPGNPDALRVALARLVGDPPLRAKLGTAARATYEARFAPEITARALGELYAEFGLPAD